MRDGLERVGDGLGGLGHDECLDVATGADRAPDHRADALDELDVDAHPEDRNHDVAVDDRSVDAVPLDGLQGHLGAQLWLTTDLEEVVLGPGLPGTRGVSVRPGA